MTLDQLSEGAYFAPSYFEGGGAVRRGARSEVQRIAIHHQHPNIRNIKLAVERLQSGEVVSYPTDTVYGLGCDYTQKKAIERLYSLKELPKKHHSTFIC